MRFLGVGTVRGVSSRVEVKGGRMNGRSDTGNYRSDPATGSCVGVCVCLVLKATSGFLRLYFCTGCCYGDDRPCVAQNRKSRDRIREISTRGHFVRNDLGIEVWGQFSLLRGFRIHYIPMSFRFECNRPFLDM